MYDSHIASRSVYGKLAESFGRLYLWTARHSFHPAIASLSRPLALSILDKSIPGKILDQLDKRPTDRRQPLMDDNQ